MIKIGESGCNCSWQSPFPKQIKCAYCKAPSRIAFVYFEGMPKLKKHVCRLHENDPEGEGYWPHDCIACAVFICRKCMRPTAIMNQA